MNDSFLTNTMLFRRISAEEAEAMLSYQTACERLRWCLDIALWECVQREMQLPIC